MKKFITVLLLAPAALIAQEAPVAPALNTDIVASFVQNLAAQAPWLIAALSLIGVLRVIFKPAMTFLHSVVKATPSTKDDEWLTKVEGSVWLSWLVWALDLFASIKLTHPKAISPNETK